MNEVTFENYRCFQEKQTVRLAPLTLLVGENSTGKTSFLALLRALCDVGYGGTVPNFRKPPYDLGTFRDIVHSRTATKRTNSFTAGFKSTLRTPGKKREIGPLEFVVDFKKQDADPFPIRRRYVDDTGWIEIISEGERRALLFGTPKGSWELHPEESLPSVIEDRVFPIQFFLFALMRDTENRPEQITRLGDTSELPDKDDFTTARRLIQNIIQSGFFEAPYAGAPVRSSPQRVYDPPNLGADPGGEYIPLYLATMRYSNRSEWGRLKDEIERFGRDAGLFDGLEVKPLDDGEGGPFQLQVRKAGGRAKGQRRNIADVGYGVSQVLPVVTELLRRDAPAMYLLQQPEVHLHPSAQAALGSLFCLKAGQQGTQLVVETHSDHLLDRVRMDVRDKATNLSPQDVSILYFQRLDLAVQVHSLTLDDAGNVLNAPESYRQFFMEETARSLGL